MRVGASDEARQEGYGEGRDSVETGSPAILDCLGAPTRRAGELTQASFPPAFPKGRRSQRRMDAEVRAGHSGLCLAEPYWRRWSREESCQPARM